ncbi:MAG: hypothetical protein JWR32_1901 [Mycobacterium sp.]|jgi:hypothetical protein|nr:hypothetical protein [Mycobacterium sp.]
MLCTNSPHGEELRHLTAGLTSASVRLRPTWRYARGSQITTPGAGQESACSTRFFAKQPNRVKRLLPYSLTPIVQHRTVVMPRRFHTNLHLRRWWHHGHHSMHRRSQA